MNQEAFETKVMELADRIEDDPTEFELRAEERERIERFLGETILAWNRRRDGNQPVEPTERRAPGSLTPIEWVLWKVVLDEIPADPEFPDSGRE